MFVAGSIFRVRYLLRWMSNSLWTDWLIINQGELRGIPLTASRGVTRAFFATGFREVGGGRTLVNLISSLTRCRPHPNRLSARNSVLSGTVSFFLTEGREDYQKVSSFNQVNCIRALCVCHQTPGHPRPPYTTLALMK